MNKRIEEELFPFYALNALTDEEKAEVEVYIANDSAAKTRLHTLQQTADLLPLTAEPVAPSPQLKANLMVRVQADSRAKMAQTAVVKPRTAAVKRPSAPQPTWWERLRQSFVMGSLRWPERPLWPPSFSLFGSSPSTSSSINYKIRLPICQQKPQLYKPY
ncbi:hypothetical protein MNBD_CHLOROFLEXI01-1517 [hydrothermal vent metagenome]|uniref:Zinc-finger domain-containing protein n=1 Tax=hydrothermal vent metagenome TaxID=652676 RepID=A0A3B0WIG0_9ZZZZ